MRPDVLAAVLEGARAAAREAELPEDGAEREHLAEAAESTGTTILSLAARLRAVADGECEPPDLDGLCMACGRKIAPPVVAGHGCNPFDFVVGPIFRLRRFGVRVTRLSRLHLAAARCRGGA